MKLPWRTNILIQSKLLYVESYLVSNVLSHSLQHAEITLLADWRGNSGLAEMWLTGVRNKKALLQKKVFFSYRKTQRTLLSYKGIGLTLDKHTLVKILNSTVCVLAHLDVYTDWSGAYKEVWNHTYTLCRCTNSHHFRSLMLQVFGSSKRTEMVVLFRGLLSHFMDLALLTSNLWEQSDTNMTFFASRNLKKEKSKSYYQNILLRDLW